MVVIAGWLDKNLPWKRMTEVHELAHVVLNIPDNVPAKEMERIVSRFAGVLLLPEESFRKMFGEGRRTICWANSSDQGVLRRLDHGNHEASGAAQVRPKGEKVGEIAAKAVVQLLFATGKSFTVDGLREKLREFFRQEVRAELRAVAALNNVELITALISFNRQLALIGLQLRILNGVVSLLTTEYKTKPWRHI